MLEECIGVAVVLPWLWPLADEDSECDVEVSPDMQKQLLAALLAISDAVDTSLKSKVSSSSNDMQASQTIRKSEQ